MSVAVINASEKYGNNAEILKLYEDANGGPTIIYVEGRSPLLVSPLEDAREFLTARLAGILANDPTLDDTLRRLELRNRGDGSTVEWKEIADQE